MLTFTLGAIHQHEAFITLAVVAGPGVNTDLAAFTIVIITFILATGVISGLILGVTTVIVAITDQIHRYAVVTTVKFQFFITCWSWKENFGKCICRNKC